MNNDPYSWFNIDRLDRLIKKEKEEFKKQEEEADGRTLRMENRQRLSEQER